MKYCQRCVTPASHPRVQLHDDGVCSACRAWERRATIDWQGRERRFSEIVEWAKAQTDSYDCLVPVSGGKDSYWQVVTALEYGLTPLTVTWRDPARLPIGQRDLDRMRAIGVDHIDYAINPEVERRFLRRSFETYAVPGIPKHMALYNIPIKVAVRFGIPLILWAENDAIEYGVAEDDGQGFRVDYEHFRRHGVTQGTAPEDWVSEDLTLKQLAPYRPPAPEELRDRSVESIFLGYFFSWDPVETWAVARRHGFEAPESGPGYHVFDDVDSGFISIHHYLKWYKFGVTRLFDNLSIDIRAGRISREDAVDVIRERGCETPHEDIRSFCEYIGITPQRFFEVAERFRDPDVWSRRDGYWVIEHFIVPDWDGWQPCAESAA